MMKSNTPNTASDNQFETAIRELQAAQKSEGNAGANIHLLYARSAIDQLINKMGNHMDAGQV